MRFAFCVGMIIKDTFTRKMRYPMKSDATKILQEQKKQISELWMKNQLVDFSLRENLSPRETGMLWRR
jgi:hypothetical protein